MDEPYTGFSDLSTVRSYLQSIDIATARKIGVEIYKIEVMAGMYNEVGMILSKNMDLWFRWPGCFWGKGNVKISYKN